MDLHDYAAVGHAVETTDIFVEFRTMSTLSKNEQEERIKMIKSLAKQCVDVSIIAWRNLNTLFLETDSKITSEEYISTLLTINPFMHYTNLKSLSIQPTKQSIQAMLENLLCQTGIDTIKYSYLNKALSSK